MTDSITLLPWIVGALALLFVLVVVWQIRRRRRHLPPVRLVRPAAEVAITTTRRDEIVRLIGEATDLLEAALDRLDEYDEVG